jgi:hypothetical protein
MRRGDGQLHSQIDDAAAGREPNATASTNNERRIPMKHIDKTATEKPLHVAHIPRHRKPDPLESAFDADEFRELLYDIGPGNPFRAGAR